MKNLFSTLFLISLLNTFAIGQETVRWAALNSIFMDLPVVENYEQIVTSAQANDQLNFDEASVRMNTDATAKPVRRQLLEKNDLFKWNFEKYCLFPDANCVDCYVQFDTTSSQKAIRLVLNFEGFNRDNYNVLLKSILSNLSKYVYRIDKDVSTVKSWETTFYFDENSDVPAVRIREYLNVFNRLEIEFVE